MNNFWGDHDKRDVISQIMLAMSAEELRSKLEDFDEYKSLEELFEEELQAYEDNHRLEWERETQEAIDAQKGIEADYWATR